MTTKEMQAQVGQWLQNNFGAVPATDQCLIIAEEVGELCHHVLKLKQGIRKNEDHEAGVEDAVGDIVIGVMAFCSVWGIDLQETVEKVWEQVSQRRWNDRPAGASVTVTAPPLRYVDEEEEK